MTVEAPSRSYPIVKGGMAENRMQGWMEKASREINTNSATVNNIAAIFAGRNKLINGNFAINQEGVSGTVSLAAGEYGHDGWKAGASGCTYTFASSEGVTTLTISAGSLVQVVEGANLFTGSHTLSWEGTAQGKVGTGSYGDSGLTEAVTGGTDLSVEFGTGTLAKAQLEAGESATVFEHLHPVDDRARCQRYFWRLEFPAVNFWADASGRYFSNTIVFPAQMAATPTVSYSVSGAISNCSISFGSASQGQARLLLQSTAASSNCFVDPIAGDYIEADARL